MNERLSQYKIPIALSLVGLVLIVGGIFSSNLTPKKPISSEDPKIKASIVEAQTNLIKVDISGAVNNPAVYALEKDSRIEDVIKQAGGFVASVSAQYVSKNLNLSQKIVDGQKIYIPFEGETLAAAAVSGVSTTATPGKIGINSATQAQLESLPGIGPATAVKIMNARPYASLGELTTKKAVSKGVFEKIKEMVDLN